MWKRECQAEETSAKVLGQEQAWCVPGIKRDTCGWHVASQGCREKVGSSLIGCAVESEIYWKDAKVPLEPFLKLHPIDIWPR